MAIPVEYLASERQRVPAVLVKIEKSIGVIKFTPGISSMKVSLSELQLAPSAFQGFEEDPFSHTRVGDLDSTLGSPSSGADHLAPHDLAEVWLSTEATSRKKLNNDDAEEPQKETSKKPNWLGAWWPGRVLNVHGGFAHVEVAGPMSDNIASDELAFSHTPNVVRLGSSVLPYRSALVKLCEIRTPWNGRPVCQTTNKCTENGGHISTRDGFSEPATLATQGVLRRHTVCIPAYLARLASSVDSHSALLKFCNAPCLIQCDPEPFLSNVLAKRIMEDFDSAAASGRQTPSPGTDSETNAPSVTVSADSQSTTSPSWPSAYSITQSTILNAPNIAGTLSSAGVTDPALLLEGLPDANGPLVLLHIWSGSAEAIRRAAILELAHVRILAFRYHLMRKLSNGEPGELDLADSMDMPVENGDAPAMYCKPISIPVHANPDDSSGAEKPGEMMMIGYSAQFRVQPKLIGLAIGYRGSTIQEARSLPGVRAIEMLPDGIIHVEAETVEACQSVRNLLDYTEAEIPVSSRLASRLIGSKGVNIRKLVASAGIRRALLLDPAMRKHRQQTEPQQQSAYGDYRPSGVKTEHEAVTEPDAANNGDTAEEQDKLPPPAFYILGTRPAVAKMRLLLEFQADNLNELDELEEARRNLSSQLRMSIQPGPKASVTAGHANENPVVTRGGGDGSFRGRGRRNFGKAGPAEHTSEENGAPPNQTNRFSHRGRPRPQNGYPNRPNSDVPTSEPTPNESGTTDVSHKPESQNTQSQNPVNGNLKRGASEARGRGRNRPRNNHPIPAS